MHRKFIAACVALVAFAAFAVIPALASASPVLTEAGKKVEGTPTIVATQATGTVIELETSAGFVKCSKSFLTGPLKANTGTTIQGQITRSSFTGTSGTGTQCESQFLGAITVDAPQTMCIHSGGKDAFEIVNGTCGTAGGNLTFTLTGSLGTCSYVRSSVTGSYNTNTTPSVLTIGASQTFSGAGEENPFICPASGTLKGSYNLFTDNAEETPLTIS
jgi:hypothetical protein